MKKIGLILLVLVMTFGMVLNAGATSSIQVGDLTKVEGIKTSTGVALPADFVLAPAQPTPSTENLLAAITAATETNGGHAVSFFSEDVQQKIAAVLPAEFDLSTLAMNEFAPLALHAYDPELGDLTVEFGFATEFEVGQEIVALAGYVIGVDAQGNDVYDWLVLEAEVIFDSALNANRVSITFSLDALEKLNDVTAVIAILSA